jgi:hypothetical protein
MIPTLSINNPVVAFRIQDHLSDGGVTLVADTGSGARPPVALARPANDDLLGYVPFVPVLENFQMCDVAYGIDVASSTQGFSITFTSDVAGTIYLCARLGFATSDASSTLSYGRWTPAGGTNIPASRNCSVTLNGSTAPYMMDGLPALTNAASNSYPNDNGPGRFVWMTCVNAISVSAPAQTFTVNKGTNTITWTQTGGGAVFEGFAIFFTGQTNWQHNLPSYKPKQIAANLGPIQNKLALATGRVVRVLFIGDSLCAHANNWADWELFQFEQKFGSAARTLKLGIPASGSADIGSAWGTHTGAYTVTSAFIGGSASFNDWSNLFGSDGYKWTQTQTGGGTLQNTSAAQWEVIYFKSPAGGSFSVTPTGGSAIVTSTAGAAGTYGILSGTFAGAGTNSLVVSKTDVASADGVALLSLRIGAAAGITGMRLAIPGTSWTSDFPAGKNASMASFLAAYQPDIIITGNANNAGNGLLYNYLVPLYTYLSTLLDSITQGYTLLLHQDLHLFVNTGATNVSLGGGNTTFGSLPTLLGPQFLYVLMTDLLQLGYFPRPISLVSFSQYYSSLRDQIQALWSENFYAAQNSAGITDSHLSTVGAAILGQTLGDIVTGRLPSADDLNAATLTAPGAVDSPGIQTLLSRVAQTVGFDSLGNVKSAAQNNVTIGGYATGQDPATLLLRNPANKLTTDTSGEVAVAPSGTGSIPITQNTGGADNLRYVDYLGNGVGGATVLIYLATDWPANPTRVQASTTTGADGRWLSPVFVNSGTYVAVFTKPGADGPNVSPPFTV